MRRNSLHVEAIRIQAHGRCDAGCTWGSENTWVPTEEDGSLASETYIFLDSSLARDQHNVCNVYIYISILCIYIYMCVCKSLVTLFFQNVD